MNLVFEYNENYNTDVIASIDDYPAHPLFIAQYVSNGIFDGIYYWSNNKIYVFDNSNTIYLYKKNKYKYIHSFPSYNRIEYEDISEKYNIKLFNIMYINELNIEIGKRLLEIICDNV